MSAPAKINFKIYQGSTFNEVLRWETPLKVYKQIIAITKTAPVVVTAVGHGAPLGWRVKFTNITGMTELNSEDTYHTVTSKTTDTLTINSINSIGYKDYISNGVVEYNTPMDMTGYTARMQLRSKLDSDTVIAELTTQNGKIVIDNENKTIKLLISATDTAAYTFSSAVYSLELVSSGGQVTPFANGIISLVKEVTR